MPLYEFFCEPCQLKFEVRKNIGDYNATCPDCGKQAKKIMSLSNSTFGWTLSEASHERFGPKDEIVRDV